MKGKYWLCPSFVLIMLGAYATLHAKEEASFFTVSRRILLQGKYPNQQKLEAWLWQCYGAPLELNTASSEELANFAFLSPTQLAHFVHHLAKTGPLISIYELQAIPHWDLVTIALLEPFVQVKSGKKGVHMAKDKVNFLCYGEVDNKVKKHESPEDSLWKQIHGKPHLKLRYHYVAKEGYSFALIGSKGVGEQLGIDKYHYPFPYIAGYLQARDIGPIKHVIVGHYNAGFGQGLLLSNFFMSGKGLEAIYIGRVGGGLRATNGFGRKSGLLGLGITLGQGPFELTCLASHFNLDATTNKSYATKSTIISNRGITFPHGDENAAEKRGSLNEQLCGIVLTYTPPAIPQCSIGAQALYQQYSKPICTQKEDVLVDKKQRLISLFGHCIWCNIHFFGEAGLNPKDFSKGVVAGMMTSLHKQIDLALLVRRYDSHFYSLHGKAFGENSLKNNEIGVYLGCSTQPYPNLMASTYLDYAYHPKAQAKMTAGTKRISWLLGSKYQKRRSHMWQLQLKGKDSFFPAEDIAKEGKWAGHDMTLTAKYDSHIATGWKLRSQFQWPILRKGSPTWKSEKASGEHNSFFQSLKKIHLGGTQDLYYKEGPLQIKLQLALFNTNYSNRVYFYRPSILPGFNYPALQGFGTFFCSLIHYKVHPSWKLSAQVSLKRCTRKEKDVESVINNFVVKFGIAYSG
jgi:hypothetical protein